MRGVTETHNSYIFEGYDLKSLLSQRIILFPQGEIEAGTYGHSAVKGSTEYCIKSYVSKNAVSPEDEERAIYGLTIAADKGLGNPSDSGFVRLDYLHEVVNRFCVRNKIGYDIYHDISNNRYRLQAYAPVDRSDNQTENNKAVFAVQLGNIISLTNRVDTSQARNVIYAVYNGSSPYVKRVVRGEGVPRGIDRFETTLNVSCSDASEIDAYALEAAEDMVVINSFEVETASAGDYGSVYAVGDIVTFIYKGEARDRLIVEAVKEYSGSGKTVKLVCEDYEDN